MAVGCVIYNMSLFGDIRILKSGKAKDSSGNFSTPVTREVDGRSRIKGKFNLLLKISLLI